MYVRFFPNDSGGSPWPCATCLARSISPHLEAYTLNDFVVMEEVLRLFQQQCEIWSPLLTVSHEGWRDAAHTIKGAAAGIGAGLLAAAAEAAEQGAVAGAEARLGAGARGDERGADGRGRPICMACNCAASRAEAAQHCRFVI